MNDESIHSIEHSLRSADLPIAPADLRANMIRTVHRRLSGERWERRLGRLAVAVLLIGVGLNWSVGWGDRNWPAGHGEIAVRPKSDSIVVVAVAIGQATDAETGQRMAQHLAALSGTTLSAEQASAINQAVQRHVKSADSDRKEGPS